MATTHHHQERALRAFYALPSHAPLLPIEVEALVRDVDALAAKRGAAPEVLALAQQLRAGAKP